MRELTEVFRKFLGREQDLKGDFICPGWVYWMLKKNAS
jgi:hypothetical protein